MTAGLNCGAINMRKDRIKNYLGRNFKKEREQDKISKKRRSILMSKVLSKNTNFEKDFYFLLKKVTNKKFQTNAANIKGKPDIVFSKERVCIFLDSDFWHGWQYPRWKHLLKNDFWKEKILKNRIRDIKNTRYLKRQGRIVLRIWEHQVKENPKKCVDKIEKTLSSVNLQSV